MISLLAKSSKVGYGKIMLSMNNSNVNGKLAANYSGSKYSEQANGDFILNPNKFTKVLFYFNHSKLLYKIFAKIKYGEAAKVKNRLSAKYGKPVESYKNKLILGEKKYLIGKWIADGRYSVTLI